MSKRCAALAGIVLILASLSGCGLFFLRGDGNVVTQTRTVSAAFDEVIASNTVDVKITKAETVSITLEIDANLQAEIEVVVEDGALCVRDADSFKTLIPTKALLTVACPSLRGMVLSGVGDVEATGFDSDQDFRAALSGTGSLWFTGGAGKMDITLSGTGAANLEGSADSLDAILSGTGALKAQSFPCLGATIVVSGTGNAACTVNGNVSALPSGTGDLDLYGAYSVVSALCTGTGRVRYH